ncbi:hypothetical protein ACI2L1_30795 [Streptomyces sp. NPDC019531]|uniref:hypothetical protein n=1 Tax=Streptomyces sp. NPDC019531 TaxID=3365062 RepID=UPI00384D1D8D
MTAAGCPLACRVLERVGDGCRLGLVVCGGDATSADVMAWADVHILSVTRRFY